LITLQKELHKNFKIFQTELKDKFSESYSGLENHEQKYFLSYKRLSTLEAWRAFVIEQTLSPISLVFFVEAQNDALLSHTFARIGSWRAALQSLRCAIENILFCLYYKDHPVELELWHLGKHKVPISDYVNYLEKHPIFLSIAPKISGIALLKKEYSTLSKAVHGSSINFRMTKPNIFPALMIPDFQQLNQWLAREAKSIQLINQLLMTIYCDDLQGAKVRNLRKSISFAVPEGMHESFRKILGIRLFQV
jgi:hypothetical protein